MTIKFNYETVVYVVEDTTKEGVILFFSSHQHEANRVASDINKRCIYHGDKEYFIVRRSTVGYLLAKKEKPLCGICGREMPEGEEMFNYHGYSGSCPDLLDEAPELV